MPNIAIEVAQQLFERIEKKDVAGITALYADDISCGTTSPMRRSPSPTI